MMSEVCTIGIVGDGQLGQMLTKAALPMGFAVTTLGPSGENSPAAQAGAKSIEGSIKARDDIRRLADEVDVVTIEIEHGNVDALVELEDAGYNVQPKPRQLLNIVDKLMQKQSLSEWDIPVAPYTRLASAYDLACARLEFGDVITKTRTGGYDGRGNLVLAGQDWESIQNHFRQPDGSLPSLYAEEIVPFERELAVIGARDLLGNVALYPIVETVHADNICHMVSAPANIKLEVRLQAEAIGMKMFREVFDGAGVFAVEMFQTSDGRVLVNEVAPRVHNSGHFTIEGSETSQFEQHVRAITGLPLGSTDMTAPAAVMVNILGTREGGILDPLELDAIRSGNVFPHNYGKSLKPARKVGHITVLAHSLYVAKSQAIQARQGITA